MMRNIIFIVFFLLPISLFSKTIWLNEIDTKHILQDWGSAQINKSVLGTPLEVNGVQYKKGIGTHSISRILLNLNEKAISFSGLAGADDRNDFSGNLEFCILADQKQVWTSGIIKKGIPAKPFNIKLKGVKKLALLVKEGGDGIMYDHADWLEAKFETEGNIIPEPIMPSPINKEKYILTPTLSEFPKINNPLVIGARPENPFLMKIIATGKRPMYFSVKDLPEGLNLDTTTGQITGIVNKKGEYNVTLTAKNEIGETTETIKIKIGDTIALTPPMGWNSWNCWGPSVDQSKVEDAATYMSEKLINHGWTYINIDDGWEAKDRTVSGELLTNNKFPDITKLTDYIHSLGLKFGIYSSPGPRTCGGYLGSYQSEETDAKTWANWGVDYLKYDYCYYNEVVPNPTEQLIKEPYVVMRKALDKVNRDIVYCVGFGAPRVWVWGAEAGGNQWRTTRDITDEWNVVRSIGFFQDVCASATKPGNYNDPDMLVVGKLGLGWGSRVHDSYLTPDEQYSHISLWCILSSPLLIGCDMNQMDDFTLNLLTNNEVIAIDQDPIVAPAQKINVPNGQIWYKKLYDGSYAIGLFNVNPYYILWDQSESKKVQETMYKLSLNLKEIGLSGKYKVRDLWRQQDLGTIDSEISAEIPYHGVKFIKITPIK